MKKILLSLLALSTFLVQNICAQQTEETGHQHSRFCGATEAIEKALLENPQLVLNLKQLEEETVQFLVGEKALDSTITIPVVFHVFHTYGSERISEAQMKDCIRILNEDFQKTASDTNLISAPFKGIAGKAQMRFRLAKKDPQGKCTKGVNYIYSNLHTTGGENLKSVVSWDTKRYLNIWVCSVVGSGAAAYAFYPGTAPSQAQEGIVTMDTYVGSIGSSSAGYQARTLTHEAGHFFNLPHTWGSSNTPGLATNCNIDDGVADTPNCRGVTGTTCNLNQNSCGQLDNVENHMEYSSCRRMFTNGQVTRMHAAVNSNMGFRRNLWQGANLVFTGTTNNGPGPECAPKADFKSSVTRVCAGVPVTFTDLSYNVNDPAGILYNWTFQGGTPSTSNAINPQVVYESGGNYSVKLVVRNSVGKDSLIQNSLIKVLETQPGYAAGEIESFESVSFPNFAANPVRNWDISSTIANTWKRTTAAKVTGAASLMITNNTSSSGAVHTLFSPVYAIEGPTTGAKLAMKYAFARRTTANTDKLVVSYSIDCGKTWSSATTRSGASLATTTELTTGTFVPDATEWRQLNLSLPFLNNSPSVRFRFEFTSDGGNNLYLEDIQLTTITAVSNLQDESLALTIAPNPSSVLPNLLIDNVIDGAAKLEIIDVLGRTTIFSKPLNLQTGQTILDLSREMDLPKAGSYWVRLVMPNRVMVRKWIVLP